MSKSIFSSLVNTLHSTAQFTNYQVTRVPGIGKPAASAIKSIANTAGTIAGHAATEMGASPSTAKAVNSITESTTTIAAGGTFIKYVDK